MEFFQTSEVLSRRDLALVEKKLDVSLPSSFQDHYLKYNGGYPERSFYYWKDGSATHINSFYSIKYGGFDNIEEVYTDLVLEKTYLPKYILPFASDDGGNLFCISCRKVDFGFIYYCNNDQYEVNDPENCLTLIEKDFTRFILNLAS